MNREYVIRSAVRSPAVDLDVVGTFLDLSEFQNRSGNSEAALAALALAANISEEILDLFDEANCPAAAQSVRAELQTLVELTCNQQATRHRAGRFRT